MFTSKNSTYKLSRPTVTNNVCYVTDFSGNLEVFTTQKVKSFADYLSGSSDQRVEQHEQKQQSLL